MEKLQNNQNGFSVVEGLLVFVIVAVIGGTGWYVYNANKKANSTYDTATQSSQRTAKFAKAKTKAATKAKATASSPKYLEIPEKGIKFQLSDTISDAYYAVDKQGYVRLSVRAFDTNPAFGGGCVAKSEDGDGVVTLIVAKPGEPGADEANDPWTLKLIQQVGLKQVGDAYYGFQKGNGPCFDPTNQAATNEFAIVEPAFIAAQPTITKL